MKVKKRPYRSTPIKGLKPRQLLGAVSGRDVIVATDVAKEKMFSSVELRNGELLWLVRWTHPDELERFAELVTAAAAVAESLETVQEPTGTFGDPLRFSLGAAGVPEQYGT